jgi:hypothetical protein
MGGYMAMSWEEYMRRWEDYHPILPTLSKIMNKYNDLVNGYDSHPYNVQYTLFGHVVINVVKTEYGVVFEADVNIRFNDEPKTPILPKRIIELLEELRENREQIIAEAQQILK